MNYVKGIWNILVINVNLNTVSISAQGLVYCISGGKKHVGLACTVHQATQSKGLVKLFNKAMSRCCK